MRDEALIYSPQSGCTWQSNGRASLQFVQNPRRETAKGRRRLNGGKMGRAPVQLPTRYIM